MTGAEKLKLGHIPYLNCVPFFHFLEESGFTGNLVSGVPSHLNHLLQQGRLDVSPSSSFEYALNWRSYSLLPGYSISSCGDVLSVLLFSPCQIPDLEGQRIAITGESATSINLLRVILREFYGLRKFTDFVPEGPVEELISEGQPALLIGDRALRMVQQRSGDMACYDLGGLWYRHTGLPFVFALWMVRKNVVSLFPAELAALKNDLTYSLKKVLDAPETIAAECAPRCGLTPGQVVEYWRSIDYRLEGVHVKGVQEFFRLCVKHELLEQVPPLQFLKF